MNEELPKVMKSLLETAMVGADRKTLDPAIVELLVSWGIEPSGTPAEQLAKAIAAATQVYRATLPLEKMPEDSKPTETTGG